MDSNLKKYLAQKFPTLKIRKPLFYSWPIGIRFELGPPGIPVYLNRKDFSYNEAYFDAVLNRALALFDFFFKSEDELVLIYQKASYGRTRIKKNNFCFRQIKNLDVSKIQYHKIKALYENEGPWYQAIVPLKAKQLELTPILKAIANQDFGSRSPQIKADIYFINLEKNFIFHMYDDRGLDVIATDKKKLKVLYDKFNPWILDYDRKKIDRIFKNI